ncbi:hypothetical protein Tco_0245830 [Tanacetum coccineum]
MKIPIIKMGEYDIWSMIMRQYICHTDHNLWDVIVNRDLEEEHAPTGETSAPPAPKTVKQLAAKRNQERVKSILLLAIPDEYLLKFHNVADAKSLWEAIKSRFGGNEESKKMQKNVLKHQFENFSTASNESLDKAYDAPISKEDINHKFLRRSMKMKMKSVFKFHFSLLRTWHFILCETREIDEERIGEKLIKILMVAGGYVDCQEKVLLLGNADLEGIKGDVFLVTMARSNAHQQINLHQGTGWLRWSRRL